MLLISPKMISMGLDLVVVFGVNPSLRIACACSDTDMFSKERQVNVGH